MKSKHRQYFIRYRDKDSCWNNMCLFLDVDDLGKYVDCAKELRMMGHRDVRIMEELTFEREVVA